ncbi:MAG: C2 family cysteine protease [Terracoccus sp.]
MAIYRKGADPVALRGSARRLEHCAATANEVCDTAGQAVVSLRASWGGGDRDALTSRWPAVEQHIRATHDTISRLSRLLDRQASEQEGTSASGAGGVPASGPGDPASYVPPGPLDQRHVDQARAAVDDVLDGPGFWDLDGNRDDLLTAKQRIAALTPAEAEALVQQLSADNLAKLATIMCDQSDVLWVDNGLDPFDRSDVTSGLLSKLTPESAAKLQTAMPWSQPGFATTDAALSGQQSQVGEQQDGMHYGLPPGQLGTETLNAQDMNQGSFGDCWAIASMTATAQADPDFVENNISVNPNGTVNVRLFDHDGNPRIVTVTPDVPLNADGNVVGAHGTDGQTWPAYYEKAFAVVYGEDQGGAPDGKSGPPYDVTEQGSYGAIEWDYNDKAPSYITGSEPTSVGGYDGAVEAFNDKSGVIVSTPATAPTDPPPGYVTRHVYYVESVNPDGSVTLGNPWGPNAQKITVDKGDFDRLFNNPQAMKPKA